MHLCSNLSHLSLFALPCLALPCPCSNIAFKGTTALPASLTRSVSKLGMGTLNK